MRALTATSWFLISAGAAMAHEGVPHGSMSTWTFDPWIVIPIVIAGGLYLAGSIRLRRKMNNTQALSRRSLAYWTGWLALVIALVSPLHFLGEHLFTAHMIEHEIVMAVAAPLIVMARPIGVLLWGLPRPARHLVRRFLKTEFICKGWEISTKASVATAIHGLAIWVWHTPALFDETVVDLLAHRLQHLSFFLTGILFWWAVIWRAGRGMAAWHLFVTMLHTSILGALIALAPAVVYVSQTKRAPGWGLTPLEDQQLAGLIMWVPGGIIYAGAALAVLALWIAGSSRGGLHAGRVHQF